MSGEGTRELVQELARDLEPVQPIARLRSVALGVIGVWLGVATSGVLLMGLRPDWAELVLAPRGAAGIFGSLALAGLGGVVGGLALGVPGREGVVRAALALGVLGFALSAGIASLLVAGSPAGSFGSGELRCLAVACAIALVPALGVVAFVGRAAAIRPLASVLAAAAGTAALGAVAAEASCPLSSPFHMLLGHVLAPVAGVLALTLPLWIALRRISRHGAR